MKCPYCRCDNDKVIDSRSGESGFVTRRRRQCLNCDRRYTTYERIGEVDIKVIKRSGSREPFSPEKIHSGLLRACVKRPISTEQLESLIARVEQQVMTEFESVGEIPSHQLGRLVMDELFRLDQVAYLRFASVYRQFSDARDFIQEVQQMLRRHHD
jgi:transcriptional repressor NrdR